MEKEACSNKLHKTETEIRVTDNQKFESVRKLMEQSMPGSALPSAAGTTDKM